ncbi:MAG: hypothetical protein RLZZ385_397 [Pseudomonadota bacterium]|jgi:membrane protease YdiL (CAAX protease family)
MSIAILILLLILAGIVLNFGLRGPALKRALRLYGVGGVLALGGCFASLAALDAETSGNGNMFNAVNPYIWPALFMFGVAVLAVNAVLIIRDRKKRGSDHGS